MLKYRSLWLLVILAAWQSVCLTACQAVPPAPPFLVTAALPTSAPATALATSTRTPPAASSLPASTPVPPPLPEALFRVISHPDGSLYVGDWVSFEVLAPPGVDHGERRVQMRTPAGQILAPVEFEGYGIAGRQQATLWWAWDTNGMPAGVHDMTFTILPDGTTWVESIRLLPRSLLPEPERLMRWEFADTDCCRVYTLHAAEAERDLADLLQIIEQQAEEVSRQMSTDFNSPISITLAPRVLGHGGFAGDELLISYLDRDYAGGDHAIVLHHEMVHLLDRQLGGDLRPTLLLEGLAVYLSGGHFKPEALLPRASALLELGWYIPLADLVDNFYPAQHEIGYLQAGALVEYMVSRWGWERYNLFYRDIHPIPADSAGDAGSRQSVSLDLALRTHFGLDLAHLESDFLNVLASQPVTPDQVNDLRLTVEFYNTVRRYQQLLDPSAYYLTAWLPPREQMRERGIVADLVRRPEGALNLTLESLLVLAKAGLRDGEYAMVEALVASINLALDSNSVNQTAVHGQ